MDLILKMWGTAKELVKVNREEKILEVIENIKDCSFHGGLAAGKGCTIENRIGGLTKGSNEFKMMIRLLEAAACGCDEAIVQLIKEQRLTEKTK